MPALAVTMPERAPQMPDVPAVSETLCLALTSKGGLA